MFWKKGVNDYFVRNKRFSIIPESANGVRCGQGCNQSLSFDITGDIYTCIKQIDNGKENIFYLGNIEEEIDENKIINILSEDGKRDIKINVKIGSEGYDELPADCSLVSATYTANGVKLGTYGVIGPVRMDYKKVVTVLENVGRILESIITNKG